MRVFKPLLSLLLVCLTVPVTASTDANYGLVGTDILNTEIPTNIHEMSLQLSDIQRLLMFGTYVDNRDEYFTDEMKSGAKASGKMGQRVLAANVKDLMGLPTLSLEEISKLENRVEALVEAMNEYRADNQLVNETILFSDVFSDMPVNTIAKPNYAERDGWFRSHFEDSNWGVFPKDNIKQPTCNQRTYNFNDCVSVPRTTPANVLHDRVFWHDYFVRFGPRQTFDKYKEIGMQQGKNRDLQKYFESTKGKKYVARTSPKPARGVKKTQQFLKGLNIAVVPHFFYDFSEIRLFVNKAASLINKKHKNIAGFPEQLSYYPFVNALKKHGAVSVEIIHRNTGTSLEAQMSDTLVNLKKYSKKIKGEPFIIISRSSGAMIVNGLKKKDQLPKNLSYWVNIGGVPRGSTVSHLKSLPDLFFGDIVRGQLSSTFGGKLQLTAFKALNKAYQLFGRDMDALASVEDSLVRENLESMSFYQPITEFTEDELDDDLGILNAIMITDSQEKWTDSLVDSPIGDALYYSQMIWGPSEGSSLLADAAIDSKNSARIITDVDHLGFRNMTPEEGIQFYLRILESGRELELF